MSKEKEDVILAHYTGNVVKPEEETKTKSDTQVKFLSAALAVCFVALIVTSALLISKDDSSSTTEISSFAGINVQLSGQDLSCGTGEYYNRFATKNIYQNRLRMDELSDEVDGNYYPTFLESSETCELKKVYFLSRHGTRLPTDGSAEEMQAFNFNNDMVFLDEGLLLPLGKEELYLTGKRFRERYEFLLDTEIEYHPRVYDFNSSAKVRALESAESFAQGFLESESNPRPVVAIKSLDQDSDPFLRFHSGCALKEFEEDREDANSSFAKLQALGEKYSPILEEHFADLDFDRNAGSIIEFATVLYTACPYEQAQGCVNENFNTGFTETACELILNETIIEIMEYLADAEDYYYGALGDQINLDQSCMLRNEIIDFLDGLSTDGIEEMNFRFAFAHAETLLPLMAHFNFSIYQDGNGVLENNIFTVESDLFSEEILHRNFRTSAVSPLGNNLAFEKYECDGEELLAILHNEIVVYEGTQEEFFLKNSYTVKVTAEFGATLKIVGTNPLYSENNPSFRIINFAL
eukprot:maker-scaffold_95-snap-gene-0.26-mRNA-1 protein AED:0.03 eAED:0.06 QI:93/0.5/0.33/1/1/1/3/0/522